MYDALQLQRTLSGVRQEELRTVRARDGALLRRMQREWLLHRSSAVLSQLPPHSAQAALEGPQDLHSLQVPVLPARR